MNKQQLEGILNNAPEGATHYDERYPCYFKTCKQGFKYWNGSFYYEYPLGLEFLRAIKDLQSQLDQLNEIERLKSRELEAENIIDQVISEQASYCSDFGNLLPVEDQESEVVMKGIHFMNGHVNKIKESNK